LSRTYFINGDLYRAIGEAEKELVLYPENTRTYYVLGLTYGYMNRERDAIAAFSKYIEYYPGSWPARNDKAWLQFRIGDIDGAIATIQPIVDSFPYTVWVQNTYCSLLISKGEHAEAKKYCTYAKTAADKMIERDWGRSYPGNDPRVYGVGLRAMRMSIDDNLTLINEKLNIRE
jgi:tetratricopeptide (TPR) repeat protein